MPDYGTLKTIHMAAAAISIAGFVLRYLWMISGSRLLTAPVTKRLPHVVDTVLLVSAVWLAVLAGIAPWTVDWLGYKVIGLLAYIVLGTIALKRVRTRTARIVSGALAISVFATIAWVARYKALPGFVAF
jgi:uncharacterized membrane protein SirB2